MLLVLLPVLCLFAAVLRVQKVQHLFPVVGQPCPWNRFGSMQARLCWRSCCQRFLGASTRWVMPEFSWHPPCWIPPAMAVGTRSWSKNPWLKTTNLVAKPDQLIKRRGKAGLIAVNKTFDEAKQWVMDRMCKEQKVEHVTGQLTHFLVEPFVPHKQEQEHYICMLSHRYHDEILFYHEGGGGCRRRGCKGWALGNSNRWGFDGKLPWPRSCSPNWPLQSRQTWPRSFAVCTSSTLTCTLHTWRSTLWSCWMTTPWCH